MRAVLLVFLSVFVAELGDKTQLATLALASAPGARWSVFLGAALALVATSAIAVIVGELLAKYLSPATLHRSAGVLFLVLGAAMLLKPTS